MTIADQLSSSDSSTPKSTSSSRTQWVDAAKGITILLVVLHHCLGALGDAHVPLGMWVAADNALTAVRMPLFFLLAGLFAGPTVNGHRGPLWRERVGKFTYLFLLWTLLHFAFFLAGAAILRQSVPAEFEMRLSRLVGAVSPMWFLLGLSAFYAVARIFRHVARAAQVIVAGIGAILLVAFGIDGAIGKLWLLVFFLIGCLFGQEIRRTVASADRVAGARALAPLRWIGTRTLPIYLMHVPAMSIIWICPPLVAAFHAIHPAAPIALVALVVTASLLVHRATATMTALYNLPALHFPLAKR